MNLCTNAYHAMLETKGTLSVLLKDIRILEQEDFWGPDAAHGNYLKLEVCDTGMDEQTLKKIFDPYFTTKDVARGTGLGLAIVRGIIEEHNGYIMVDSEIGKGSRFTILFPVIESQAEKSSFVPSEKMILPKGTERIMVVDDEESILFSTRELLEGCGYHVTVFSDGLLALNAFKQGPDQFDLIITDMTMPKMTGDELSLEILKIRPGLPLILCTGYSGRISEDRARQIGICKFVQKPLISQELTEIIRSVFI